MLRKLLESLGPHEFVEDHGFTPFIALLATWFIFGGLHLTAWNFPFVTEAERITWRVASLFLTGVPLAMLGFLSLAGWLEETVTGHHYSSATVEFACIVLGSCAGLCSRLILVGLMLASLRALPCSSYQTISWTAYIPHF